MKTYAIQIMFDGHWQYVMDISGKRVQEFTLKETAEKVAKDWRKPNQEDAVRVVEYYKDGKK